MQTVKKKPGKVNKGKASSTPPPGGKRKTAIRVKTLADLRRFMARTLNDLDADKIVEGKARVLGYLCSVLMGIIKDGDLEARILKLEEEARKHGNAR